MNKTSESIEDVTLKLMSHDGTVKLVSTTNTVLVPMQGLKEGTLFIEIDNSLLSGDRNKIKIGVYQGDKLIETTTANFLGPRTFN